MNMMEDFVEADKDTELLQLLKELGVEAAYEHLKGKCINIFRLFEFVIIFRHHTASSVNLPLLPMDRVIQPVCLLTTFDVG